MNEVFCVNFVKIVNLLNVLSNYLIALKNWLKVHLIRLDPTQNPDQDPPRNGQSINCDQHQWQEWLQAIGNHKIQVDYGLALWPMRKNDLLCRSAEVDFGQFLSKEKFTLIRILKAMFRVSEQVWNILYEMFASKVSYVYKKMYFAPKNCFSSLFCELQEMLMDFKATFLQFPTIY